ncbi:hypothetical protein RSK20926_16127 [Roseobacter sp. SK209-2-6]|nr:hypothetical protein RSK20926_16127 [Roseobacter sp. SK209-2-6]
MAAPLLSAQQSPLDEGTLSRRLNAFLSKMLMQILHRQIRNRNLQFVENWFSIAMIVGENLRPVLREQRLMGNRPPKTLLSRGPFDAKKINNCAPYACTTRRV